MAHFVYFTTFSPGIERLSIVFLIICYNNISIMTEHTTFGAFPNAHGVRFSVWAPEAKQVDLVLYAGDGKTEDKRVALNKDNRGIFNGEVKVHLSFCSFPTSALLSTC